MATESGGCVQDHQCRAEAVTTEENGATPDDVGHARPSRQRASWKGAHTGTYAAHTHRAATAPGTALSRRLQRLIRRRPTWAQVQQGCRAGCVGRGRTAASVAGVVQPSSSDQAGCGLGKRVQNGNGTTDAQACERLRRLCGADSLLRRCACRRPRREGRRRRGHGRNHHDDARALTASTARGAACAPYHVALRVSSP